MGIESPDAMKAALESAGVQTIDNRVLTGVAVLARAPQVGEFPESGVVAEMKRQLEQAGTSFDQKMDVQSPVLAVTTQPAIATKGPAV